MRWMLEVAYIGILSSWRWLLGSAAVVGALVGLLLAVGVLGGGSDGSGAESPSAIASLRRLSTTQPAPSPITKPSARTSNGVEWEGESAPMALNLA